MTYLPKVIVTRRLLLREPSDRDLPEIVREINAAVGKALAAADVRERFAVQGYDVGGSTPEALQALIAAEVAKYGRIIKELGLTSE